ncbi:hypothetical protein ACJX0J_035620, partial [Zea mays]
MCMKYGLCVDIQVILHIFLEEPFFFIALLWSEFLNSGKDRGCQISPAHLLQAGLPTISFFFFFFYIDGGFGNVTSHNICNQLVNMRDSSYKLYEKRNTIIYLFGTCYNMEHISYIFFFFLSIIF